MKVYIRKRLQVFRWPGDPIDEHEPKNQIGMNFMYQDKAGTAIGYVQVFATMLDFELAFPGEHCVEAEIDCDDWIRVKQNRDVFTKNEG